MVNKFLTPLFTFILISACSQFDKQNFLTTENIAQIDNEKFIYSVYKIDYDSFNILFRVVVESDTAEIFTANIPDGVYSENSFHFKTSNDTLTIFDPRQTGTFYYNTKKGTTVKHTKL